VIPKGFFESAASQHFQKIPWFGFERQTTTNQNPRIEWRRFVPPLDSWVLCPKQDLLCYMIATITVASMKY
jgi:hypothetical protein